MKKIIGAIFALGVFTAIPAHAGTVVAKPQQQNWTGTIGTIADTAIAAEAPNKANIAAGGTIAAGAPKKPQQRK